jgi:hypothetical protein
VVAVCTHPLTFNILNFAHRVGLYLWASKESNNKQRLSLDLCNVDAFYLSWGLDFSYLHKLRASEVLTFFVHFSFSSCCSDCELRRIITMYLGHFISAVEIIYSWTMDWWQCASHALSPRMTSYQWSVMAVCWWNLVLVILRATVSVVQ